MKKKIIYIIATLLSIWGLKNILVKKTPNTTIVPTTKNNDELFLKDINFSDGKYMLYINHQKFGKFAVTDKEVIKSNIDSLKIKTSLVNFLPGEGSASYGVMLFKNNKLIKHKSGTILKVFDIGNLKSYGIPVKKHRFYGVKSEIKNKIDYLKTQKNAYITLQQETSKNDKEFRFTVSFPSIVVPVTRNENHTVKTINGIDYNNWTRGRDNAFNKYWKDHIRNYIYNKAKPITDFNISISNTSPENSYIYYLDNGKVTELRNSKNQMLYVNDFMFFNYKAHIKANKEIAEKLLTLNYNNCINKEDQNIQKVNVRVQKLLLQNKFQKLKTMGITGYRDNTKKSAKPIEQTYLLNWLTIGE